MKSTLLHCTALHFAAFYTIHTCIYIIFIAIVSLSLLPAASLLITLVATPDSWSWEGYVYAVTLFAISMGRTVIVQQYWVNCFIVGMRLRTAVTAAVYRKVRPTTPITLYSSALLSHRETVIILEAILMFVLAV